MPHLNRAPKIWIHGGGSDQANREASIDAALERMDGSPLTPAERRDVTINDRALLIYTSGTTGLPKAASISHRRILNWGGWFAGLTDASPEDRLYDCLPLFHSVGGIVAPCSMLTAGASVVLSDKFSVGPFLARYRALGLHAVPVYRRALPLSSEGAAIRISKANIGFGSPAATACAAISGKRFRRASRFRKYSNFMRRPKAISRSTMSRAGRARSAGFRRCWRIVFRRRSFASTPSLAFPFATRTDFAFACARGEVGEAIGRIGTADDGGGRFEGYTDAAETEKKILRDVLAKGDAWFRTGDLMRLDEGGYFHFVDRVGDTFRWKGENVATSEVNQAVVDCPGVVDATTYGVEIPGADGRAGMVAVVVDDGFDLADIAASSLAAGCRPMPVRSWSASARRWIPPRPSSKKSRS